MNNKNVSPDAPFLKKLNEFCGEQKWQAGQKAGPPRLGNNCPSTTNVCACKSRSMIVDCQSEPEPQHRTAHYRLRFSGAIYPRQVANGVAHEVIHSRLIVHARRVEADGPQIRYIAGRSDTILPSLMETMHAFSHARSFDYPRVSI